MSRLYIHIGAKKTGSTSLQSFLKEHSAHMRSGGIYVSSALGATEDRCLSALYMGAASREAVRRKRTFLRECNAFFAEGGKAALVTAESLSDLTVDEIGKLKHDLEPYFTRFSIVFYVRRQDLAAVSHYSTLLKGGGVSKRLMSRGLGRRGRRALSYGSIVRDWRAVFSAENLSVRKYVEKWQGSWNIIDDFLRELGLEGVARPTTGNRNLPLSGEAAAYLRRYNELAKRGQVDASPKMRRRLLNAIQAIESASTIPKPARQSAIKFLRSFDRENEIVRRLYFPQEESLFDENFDMYPEEATDIDTLLSDEFSTRLSDLLLKSCANDARSGAKLKPTFDGLL